MRELNEVIVQITWTVRDVCDAFCKQFGREPTEQELSACLESFSAKQLEERSTEFGWDFIYDAVEKQR